MEESSKGVFKVKESRRWQVSVIVLTIIGFLYFIIFWFFLWPVIADALLTKWFHDRPWYWALIWLAALILWSIPLCILLCVCTAYYKVHVKKREPVVSNNVEVTAPPYPTQMCLIQPADQQEKSNAHPVPTSFPALTIKNGQSPHRISELAQNERSSSSSFSSLFSKQNKKEDVSTRALYGGSRDKVADDARLKLLADDRTASLIPGKRASDIGYITAKHISSDKKKSSSTDQINHPSLEKFSQELIESKVSSTSSSSSSSEKLDKKSDSIQFTLEVSDRKPDSVVVTQEGADKSNITQDSKSDSIPDTQINQETTDQKSDVGKITSEVISSVDIEENQDNIDTTLSQDEEESSDEPLFEEQPTQNTGEKPPKIPEEQETEDDDDVFLAERSSKNSSINEFNQYLHLVPITSSEAEPSRESVSGAKHAPLRRDSSEFFIASAYKKPSVTSEVFLTISGDESRTILAQCPPPPQGITFVGSKDTSFHQVQ
jgi:hypothetical protein